MTRRSIRPARWPELSALLDKLFDLPEDQRPAFLDREVGEDTELRSAADALLAAGEKNEHFLGPSASRVAASLLAAERAPAARRLGPYELEAELGRGAMGVVYEARDHRLGRTVAVKVLTEGIGIDDRARKRFLREARAVSKLDHPNICTVHDLGEADETLYIVMARYRGETLQERLRRGPLPADEALRITSLLAHGLACAHDAGIVHRDIKPANVFLTEQGEVKILDFGVAKVADEAALTRTDSIPGTLAYMAPEQLNGETVDARTDLWALGVLLYQMLAGALPFRAETTGGMVRAILDDTPTAIVDRSDTGVVRAVLAATLAKRPADRFADARALIAALAGALPVRRWSASFGGRRTQRRLLAAVVLVLVVIGVAWAWRGSQAPRVHALAILPFAVEGDLPDLEGLGWSLPWMFAEAVRRRTGIEVIEVDADGAARVAAPGVAVAGPTKTGNASADVVAAARADHAELTGAHIVYGRIRQDGATVRVAIDVFAPSGKRLGQARQEGDLSQRFWSMLNALGTSLFADLGVALATPFRVEESVVGTNSTQAWFLYQKAMGLADDGAFDRAAEILAQATARDEHFLLAWSDLGILYGNLDRRGEAERCFARAFEHWEQLPQRQGLAVLAAQAATQWSTYSTAQESLETLVQRFPGDTAARDNLGAILGWLEEIEEALGHYEQLIEGGTRFIGTYKSAANMAVALGQPAHAHALLDRAPAESVAAQWNVAWTRGWIANESGNFAVAEKHFSEAEALRPNRFSNRYERWRMAVVTEDGSSVRSSVLARAQAIADPRVGGAEVAAYEAWWAAFARGKTHLLAGATKQALQAFEEAGKAYAERGFGALAHCLVVEVLLARGEAEAALALARLAQEEGRGKWPALQASFLAALASAQLGQRDEVEYHSRTLSRRVHARPNKPEARQLRRLEGLLAMGRGDPQTAVTALEQAADLLPVRGIEFHPYHLPDHVAVVYELAEALLAAGQPEAARQRFEQATRRDVMRVHAPLAFVRSLYRLGEMAVAADDPGRGKRYFRAFLGYREDADIDQGWVAAARAYLAAAHPSWPRNRVDRIGISKPDPPAVISR